MDPGDADREELEDRVEQLEQTVSKMLPDRRGVLKGLGAAAVGGAAVGASTGGASGQSGPAGSVGTPENPVDVDAWDLDVANEVVTDLPMAGNDITNAGAVSTARRSTEQTDRLLHDEFDDANIEYIYVDPNNGSDSAAGSETDPVATIQEAWNRIPALVEGRYSIDLSTAPSLPVTYPEDLQLTGKYNLNTDAESNEAGHTAVRLLGDSTAPSNVKINSANILNCWGTNMPVIRGVEFQNASPYADNEDTHVLVDNCSGPLLFDMSFSGTAESAVTVWGGTADLLALDIDNVAVGVNAKASAQVDLRSLSGTASSRAVNASGAIIHAREDFRSNGGYGTSNKGVIIGDEDGRTVVIGADALARASTGAYAPIRAETMPGGDGETRLDQALTAANPSDVVILENRIYSTDRTISDAVTLRGTEAARQSSGTQINAVWTLDDNVHIEHIDVRGELILNSSPCAVNEATLNFGNGITVNVDDCKLTNLYGGEVSFATGTSGGLVDSSVGTTFTDPDGNNTVGDIS